MWAAVKCALPTVSLRVGTHRSGARPSSDFNTTALTGRSWSGPFFGKRGVEGQPSRELLLFLLLVRRVRRPRGGRHRGGVLAGGDLRDVPLLFLLVLLVCILIVVGLGQL